MSVGDGFSSGPAVAGSWDVLAVASCVLAVASCVLAASGLLTAPSVVPEAIVGGGVIRPPVSAVVDGIEFATFCPDAIATFCLDAIATFCPDAIR